jgi:hypothetical protein
LRRAGEQEAIAHRVVVVVAERDLGGRRGDLEQRLGLSNGEIVAARVDGCAHQGLTGDHEQLAPVPAPADAAGPAGRDLPAPRTPVQTPQASLLAAGLVREILDAVRLFSAGIEQTDDITIVVVRRM